MRPTSATYCPRASWHSCSPSCQRSVSCVVGIFGGCKKHERPGHSHSSPAWLHCLPPAGQSQSPPPAAHSKAASRSGYLLTHSLTHHTQSSRMSRAVLPPPSSCMLHRLSSRRHVTTRQGRLRPEAVQLDVSMLSLPPAPLKLSYCQATVRKTPSLS